VGVPTLGRNCVLIQSLEDLLAREFRPLEVLVVDQSNEPSREKQEPAERRPDVTSWCRVSFRGLPMGGTTANTTSTRLPSHRREDIPVEGMLRHWCPSLATPDFAPATLLA
jgi:hypothetical protein